MESIRDRVAIIGMGCTKFGENWDKGIDDLIIDAAYEAFEDAGVESRDIQAAWFGSVWSGNTGQVLATALKLDYVPVTRVENLCATGSDALRNACYAVAAGMCDVALALGVEKLKDSGFSGLPKDERNVSHTSRDRTHTAPSSFALLALRYFKKYDIAEKDGKRVLAQIEVKNHHNGSLHPKAHFQREITIDQVMNAPIISRPLGLFDCCGISDGAAAAIVTRADLAKGFRADPIYVKALQIAVGPKEGYMSTSYDFAHVEETYRCGKAAYTEAGISDPKQISMAEVHDCFSITELVTYEDLGWSPRGRGKDDVEAGTFTLTGQLPVNTDGGLKCFGHPVSASGLRMMYEVYKQLQGKAGPRQVRNPGLGLTHNLGGTPGAGIASVVIAGNSRS